MLLSAVMERLLLPAILLGEDAGDMKCSASELMELFKAEEDLAEEPGSSATAERSPFIARVSFVPASTDFEGRSFLAEEKIPSADAHLLGVAAALALLEGVELNMYCCQGFVVTNVNR